MYKWANVGHVQLSIMLPRRQLYEYDMSTMQPIIVPSGQTQREIKWERNASGALDRLLRCCREAGMNAHEVDVAGGILLNSYLKAKMESPSRMRASLISQDAGRLPLWQDVRKLLTSVHWMFGCQTDSDPWSRGP